MQNSIISDYYEVGEVACRKEADSMQQGPAPRWGAVNQMLLVLLCSDLVIWASFFALMPFLPERIVALGHSGTVVGLILGVRLLSQQGTMPISGALADRWGYRRTLLTGLAVRAAGFTMMAAASSATMLAVSAVLAGVGGSLLGSALKASYTEAPGNADLAARFLWLAIADRLGQVVGPLAGAAVDPFPQKASLGAALAIAVFIAVMLLMPEQGGTSSRPIWQNVLSQFRNRRLVGLVAVLCGYWAVQQQMSVMIPLAAGPLGIKSGVGKLFSLSAVAGLVLILLLPRVRMEHLWRRLFFAQFLTAASIAIPMAVPGYLGIVLTTVGLAVAAVLGQPAMDALVGAMSTQEARGSAYGFAALSFGVGGALGQLIGGWAWSLWSAKAPWAPWTLFAAVGLLTLAGLYLLDKGVDEHERAA